MGIEHEIGWPYRVVSAIPGRVRIQVGRQSGSKRLLIACSEHLNVAAFVLRTRVAEDASSVVVEYDRCQRSLDSFLDCLQSHIWAFLRNASRLSPGNQPTFALSNTAYRKKNTRCVNRTSLSAAAAILHSIPGRLGIHVPALRVNGEAASRIEIELIREKGIRDVRVQRGDGIVLVRYNSGTHRPAAILRTVRRLLSLITQSSRGHREVEAVRDLDSDESPEIHPLLLPSAAVALAITGLAPAFITAGILAAAALPIAARALDGVRKRRANVDQLDVAALVVLALMGDLFTGSLITWLIGLGDLIRDMTMRRSRRAISELMSPAGQHAWVEQDGVILSMSLEELNSGDIVLVYPGDQIPVDGVIVGGRALVDMKILTGESTPVAKELGDTVFALATLVDGHVAVRVEHIGSATRAGQVAAMIEDAPLSDTRIQNYAAVVGDNLVLPIFALAALTYLVTGDLFRLAAVLILDFATGIRVAAPTTILSAMAGAARRGLFIKGGKALEQLAKVNAVVFDKTGTLTCGTPFVTDIHALTMEYSETEVLRFAASAEAKLRHPSAKAVVDAAEHRNIEVVPPIEMEYTLGMGVTATIEGVCVSVGSERFMHLLDVEMDSAADLTERHSQVGDSLVYVSADGRVIGLLAYSDPVRVESRLVLDALRSRGIKRIVMLTGDNARAAQTIADELGITDVISDAFPEQKADVVDALRGQGFVVAVIGDGVNDAPAFARADVGISLASCARARRS